MGKFNAAAIFFKWPRFLNAAKSGMPPISKMVPLVCRIDEPSVLLLSKSAQSFHLSAGLLVSFQIKFAKNQTYLISTTTNLFVQLFYVVFVKSSDKHLLK